MTMRHCPNEKADYYEEVGSDLSALLRSAAQTLEELDGYAWADFKLTPVHDHPEYPDGDFLFSMDVH